MIDIIRDEGEDEFSNKKAANQHLSDPRTLVESMIIVQASTSPSGSDQIQTFGEVSTNENQSTAWFVDHACLSCVCKLACYPVPLCKTFSVCSFAGYQPEKLRTAHLGLRWYEDACRSRLGAALSRADQN